MKFEFNDYEKKCMSIYLCMCGDDNIALKYFDKIDLSEKTLVLAVFYNIPNFAIKLLSQIQNLNIYNKYVIT